MTVPKWRLFWAVGGADVFDEEDFVSDFVVEEFVDGSAGEEEAESAGAHALFFAEAGVCGGVVGGIGDGGVGEGFGAESGARVADVEDAGACGADGGDFDDLIGIEGGAVLHGVEEDFAEALHDVLEGVAGEALGEVANEGEKAVGVDEAGDDADGDPSGARGDEFEVIVQLILRDGALGEAGDLGSVEGRGEAGEDAGAEGGDDVFSGALGGEDDALYAGMDEAHFFEQSEVFGDGAVGIGDDGGDGVVAQLEESVGVAGGELDGDGLLAQGVGNGETDLGAVSNNENAAHRMVLGGSAIFYSAR